jgi:pimeloyl-ACP methyl ester carboxylesterase
MSDYPDTLYKSEAGYYAVMAEYDRLLESIPVDYQSHTVQTGIGPTHMLVCGPQDAPPLVLVQGYGVAAPLWKNQLAGFAAHRRVYALDIPGQPGRSTPNVPDIFNDGYAHWLIDVLDALDLPQTDIAGVCLGGYSVMRLSAHAPGRIRRAVLLSPVGIARFKIYLRSGIPLVLNFGKDTNDAGLRLLRMAFTPPGSGLEFDREMARALIPVIKHYRVGVVAGIYNQRPNLRELWRGARALWKFVRGEPRRELQRMTAPTLLLVGEHEAIYDPHRAVKRAAKHMPHTITQVIPQAGHATIYDRPDFVNQRILHYLETGT